MANKTQSSYRQVFNALLELEPSLHPVSILSDFEVACLNSCEAVFSDAIHRGCFFHFVQCIWRQVQSSGLQERYAKEEEFAHEVKKLAALAFIPVDDVTSAFEQLTDSEFYKENDNCLHPLIDYFEDTWIGRLKRGGNRRSPKFPIRLWNCYETIIDEIPRTNNSDEGWHNGFSSLLQAQHSTIWKFIDGLKKEQSLQAVNISQCLAGRTGKKKRKYSILDSRILTGVQEYNKLD